MRVRILVGFFLMAAAVVSLYAFAQTREPVLPTPGQPGRYQVVSADIDLTTMSGALKHKTAIRIDTQTGQTWELVELEAKNGGRSLHWDLLGEVK
jgi:hypothetical protein